MQETFLSKQDLGRLNSTHADFYGVGESTTDYSTRLICGQIPGGVAVLWHKKYDQLIKVVWLGVDWAIGLESCGGDKRSAVLNVSTPFESSENESEYLNGLAYIMAYTQNNSSSSIFIVGDWNADISDHRSIFAKHLKHFCSGNGLFFSSEMLLPNDSYTYTSEAWHTTSWLDHCMASRLIMNLPLLIMCPSLCV